MVLLLVSGSFNGCTDVDACYCNTGGARGCVGAVGDEWGDGAV